MSPTQQGFYFFIVFILFINLLIKDVKGEKTFLLVLIFWAGLFAYIDRIGIPVYNLYKILVVGLVLKILKKPSLKFRTNFDTPVNTAFILFTIHFWVSYLFRGGPIITILSQYLYKYSLTYLLFHCFKGMMFDMTERNYYLKFLFKLIKIQVGLSILKLIIVGNGTYEAIVGSISAKGAGVAVVLPIVLTILYWVAKEGKIKRKDWFKIMSFVLISFASAKRQTIIIFPLIIYFLFTYVSRKFEVNKFAKYLIFGVIFFVLGAKLNPTFNPERKVWGSFDLNYVTDYILEYNFGTSDVDEITSNTDETKGRGATIANLAPSDLGINSWGDFIIGNGVRYIAVTSGRNLEGYEQEGLRGSVLGIIHGFGYLGTLLMVLFAYSIIYRLKEHRLANLLFGYYLYEFLFYANQVMFTNQSIIIVLFIIFTYNSKYIENLKNERKQNENIISS
jgi:hypothetical protein